VFTKEGFMIRRTKDGCHALLALSALLLAAPAYSQAPQAAPAAQGKAAEPAKKIADPGAKPDPKTDKPAGKPDDKPGKPEVNPGKAEGTPGKADEKAADKTVAAVQRKEADEAKLKERLERRKSQEEAERTKIAAVLKGQPMTEAMRQELTRHARRLARLERIKAVASEAKDSVAVLRATKLIDMENTRHDKFAANAGDKDEKAGAK
jgi:hypothetical protein